MAKYLTLLNACLKNDFTKDQNTHELLKIIFMLQYKNPDVAKRDVLNALGHFGDLRPKPDDFGISFIFNISFTL